MFFYLFIRVAMVSVHYDGNYTVPNQNILTLSFV